MPLPETRTSTGRPVWEPPILDYSAYIGEEYEKQREGVLKFYDGDVVKTTKFLDVWVELKLFYKYKKWARDEEPWRENKRHDGFFRELVEDINWDFLSVLNELVGLGVVMERNDDGTYRVFTNREADRPALLEPEKKIPKDDRQDATLPDLPVQYPQEGQVVGLGSPLVTTINLPLATPQMTAQPQIEATETTPLLSVTSDVNGRAATESSSAIICGCPCS